MAATFDIRTASSAFGREVVQGDGQETVTLRNPDGTEVVVQYAMLLAQDGGFHPVGPAGAVEARLATWLLWAEQCPVRPLVDAWVVQADGVRWKVVDVDATCVRGRYDCRACREPASAPG